jgi:hypothetical protein
MMEHQPSSLSVSAQGDNLVHQFGSDMAEKLLEIDAEISQLYHRGVERAGLNPEQVRHAASPLLCYIDIETTQRHRKLASLAGLFVAVIVVALAVTVCHPPTYRLVCAYTRILCIKVGLGVGAFIKVLRCCHVTCHLKE